MDRHKGCLYCLRMSANFSTNQTLSYESFLYIQLALNLTKIILLAPLSTFVLSLGFQQWKRSVSSAAVMSFSDFFTYNMAIMELIGVSGYTIAICAEYANLPTASSVGTFIAVFPWSGQMYFPILTCGERYVAVVHPIAYLRLRQGGGVRVRNISTGLVWLQCFAGIIFMVVMSNYINYILIPSTIQFALMCIALIFCSLSVLGVLTRPRPGEAGRNGVRVDQSKQRAFNTIIIIMGVLLFRFGGNLLCNVVFSLPTVSYRVKAVALLAGAWFNLPSSLVLPLLFLHRARKLPGRKHNTESG